MILVHLLGNDRYYHSLKCDVLFGRKFFIFARALHCTRPIHLPLETPCSKLIISNYLKFCIIFVFFSALSSLRELLISSAAGAQFCLDLRLSRFSFSERLSVALLTRLLVVLLVNN